MSAGNLVGTIFNCIAFTAMWVVLGLAIDKVGLIFNRTIQILPTFQDAVNGFQITQTIWIVITIIAWIVFWVNYVINESNEATGLV